MKYSKKDLTEAFPSGAKPVHKGLYLTDSFSQDNLASFQYWNGKFWGSYGSLAYASGEYAKTHASFYQNPSWRGLKVKP